MASKTEALDVSEKAVRSHEAGRHFVLSFIIKYGKYCLGDEAGGCFSLFFGEV